MKNEKKNLQFGKNERIKVELKKLKSNFLDFNFFNIQDLYKKGYIMYDPGLTSTAICKSKITYIDGKNGILLYRGYPINQLVKFSSYLEVSYILIYGNKPNKKDFLKFKNLINKNFFIKKNIFSFLNGFSKKTHPMIMLSTLISAYSTFLEDFLDYKNEKNLDKLIFQLFSKVPILASICFRYLTDKSYIFPSKEFSYIDNFLHMFFSTKEKKHNFSQSIIELLEKFFILHADHEQNVSTFTVRVIGSTGVSLLTCISSAIFSLYGKLHGGASENCFYMLKKIKTFKDISRFIQKVKNKKNSIRLMGFGHRIYKNYDPRAVIMKSICRKIVKETNKNSLIFEIANELERVALNDSYFIEKKLYPNIDFYSGIFLNSLGIPSNMFGVIFSVSRIAGWISHWREMFLTRTKILRPRQLYIGEHKRNFKNI